MVFTVSYICVVTTALFISAQQIDAKQSADSTLVVSMEGSVMQVIPLGYAVVVSVMLFSIVVYCCINSRVARQHDMQIIGSLQEEKKIVDIEKV